MRNIKRTSKPAVLERNEKKWTSKLLEAEKSGDQKKIKNARNKYRHEDIKAELVKMYGGLCCFCESYL